MRRWRFEAPVGVPEALRYGLLRRNALLFPKSLISAFGATVGSVTPIETLRFSFAPQWGIVRNTHQKQQK